MGDLEFSKKPRRMTSPPWADSQTYYGTEGVQVIMETDQARIAYFAREATWGDIMSEPTEEELADTLAEVATGKTLSASLRSGFGFRIRASRVTMDQMLRLAEGSGGAGSGAGAQTTRDNDLRRFNLIVPETVRSLGLSDDKEHRLLYDELLARMDQLRELYGEMVDAGVPPQDARYLCLPQGFQTQWMHVMDMRAMKAMCEHRLCNGLVQWETNYLVRIMRDLVVAQYPWADKLLRSTCEKNGKCTINTMLFPPCMAFSPGYNNQTTPMEKARGMYDPEKHLYPPEQNSAMEYAAWDQERSYDEDHTTGDEPIPFSKEQ